MEPLDIDGTDDTPKIILDKKKGIFEISGRSLPEDSVEFYRPIMEWISNYAKEPNATTEFVFKLEYSNTSSSKLIQDVMIGLEKIKGVKIIWCFQKDDEDMEEAGREFAGRIEIPFEFKSV